MKIAITGATGFIGQHVINSLQNKEVEIVAIARDINKLEKYKAVANIFSFDIKDVNSDFYNFIGQPDALIHLAWEGLPNYKSLHHFEIELGKQYHFLKTMIDSGLKSLVVTGTCFEYGMQSGVLYKDAVTCPANPYGYAKDALRKQLQFLKSKKNFNLAWTRLFYMYGEGQAASSLYSQLKDAVKSNQDTFNMSQGDQLRDYLPVEEVASQISHLALSSQDVGVINICSGKPVSVRRMVEEWLVKNDWHIKLNLGHFPYADYESMAFWGMPDDQ